MSIDFIVGAVIFAIFMIPISKVAASGHWALVFFIIMEAFFAFIAISAIDTRHGESAFIILIGWSVISVVSTLAIIGTDIRDAILARETNR